MYRKIKTILLLVAAALNFGSEIILAQEDLLEAKLSNASLPTGLAYSKAVYDGEDNVYIFGG
jgi:hypothetical protein